MRPVPEGDGQIQEAHVMLRMPPDEGEGKSPRRGDRAGELDFAVVEVRERDGGEGPGRAGDHRARVQSAAQEEGEPAPVVHHAGGGLL